MAKDEQISSSNATIGIVTNEVTNDIEWLIAFCWLHRVSLACSFCSFPTEDVILWLSVSPLPCYPGDELWFFHDPLAHELPLRIQSTELRTEAMVLDMSGEGSNRLRYLRDQRADPLDMSQVLPQSYEDVVSMTAPQSQQVSTNSYKFKIKLLFGSPMIAMYSYLFRATGLEILTPAIWPASCIKLSTLVNYMAFPTVYDPHQSILMFVDLRSPRYLKWWPGTNLLFLIPIRHLHPSHPICNSAMIIIILLASKFGYGLKRYPLLPKRYGIWWL